MTDPMTSDELLALADRLDAAQDPNNPDAQVIGYSLAESMRAAAAVLRATASDNPTGTYPDLVLQLRSLSDRSCNAAADIIEQVAAERDAAVARAERLEAAIRAHEDLHRPVGPDSPNGPIHMDGWPCCDDDRHLWAAADRGDTDKEPTDG